MRSAMQAQTAVPAHEAQAVLTRSKETVPCQHQTTRRHGHRVSAAETDILTRAGRQNVGQANIGASKGGQPRLAHYFNPMEGGGSVLQQRQC